MDFELSDDQRAIVEAVDALLARHAGRGARDRAREEGRVRRRARRRARGGRLRGDRAGRRDRALEAALLVEAVARAGRRGLDRGDARWSRRASRVARSRARSRSRRRATPARCASRRTRARCSCSTAKTARVASRSRPGDVTPVRSNFGYPIGRVSEAARARGDIPGARVRRAARGLVARGAGRRGARRDATPRSTSPSPTSSSASSSAAPIGSFQAVQHRLAECAVLVRGRALARATRPRAGRARRGAPTRRRARARGGAAACSPRRTSSPARSATRTSTTCTSGACGCWRCGSSSAAPRARSSARSRTSAGERRQPGSGRRRAAGDRDARAAPSCCTTPLRASSGAFPRRLWAGSPDSACSRCARRATAVRASWSLRCEALGARGLPGSARVETFIATQLLPDRSASASRRAGAFVVGRRAAASAVCARRAASSSRLAGARAWRARPRGTSSRSQTLGGEPWGRVRARARRELGRAGALAAAGSRARRCWPRPGGGRARAEPRRARAHAQAVRPRDRRVPGRGAAARRLPHPARRPPRRWRAPRLRDADGARRRRRARGRGRALRAGSAALAQRCTLPPDVRRARHHARRADLPRHAPHPQLAGQLAVARRARAALVAASVARTAP